MIHPKDLPIISETWDSKMPDGILGQLTCRSDGTMEMAVEKMPLDQMLGVVELMHRAVDQAQRMLLEKISESN